MDHPLALITNLMSDATMPGALAGRVADEVARLTSRDRRLLDLLAQHQTLTTEQITALAFTSERRARLRLLQLHQRQVLDRFRHLVRPGSQQWRWTLGPVGAAVAAATAGQPTPRPNVVRAATARLATSPRLHHLLAVNQFFCALAAHARHHPDTALLRWWPERRAAHATGGLVHPDGAGLWVAAGHQVPFWLELDRGSEPHSRLLTKLRTGYRRLASITDLAWPVLFWLPNRTREANLHKLLHRSENTYVVVATAAGDTAGAHPAGPVWQVHGQPGSVWRSLHQIPTTVAEQEGTWHA
jgi:hypothetical protein